MWGMGSMGLLWILFLAAVVVLVWYLVSGTQTKPSSDAESPVEILKRRYARGEIDTETYEKTLQELKR